MHVLTITSMDSIVFLFFVFLYKKSFQPLSDLESTTNTNLERKHPNFQDSAHYHLEQSHPLSFLWLHYHLEWSHPLSLLWLLEVMRFSHEFNSGFNAVFFPPTRTGFHSERLDFTTEQLIVWSKWKSQLVTQETWESGSVKLAGGLCCTPSSLPLLPMSNPHFRARTWAIPSCGHECLYTIG